MLMVKRRPSKPIASQLRFCTDNAEKLTLDEVAFGRAVTDFLADTGKIMPECDELLRIVLDLGYCPPSRGSVKHVAQFKEALHEYKRANGRPFPSWSEVLGVLLKLGWKKR